MCTHPNPSYRSVRASTRALGVAVLAALHSVLFLLLALASAPFRCLRSFRRPPRPAALAHVDVQVHLGNPACIAELEAIIWKTVARRTDLGAAGAPGRSCGRRRWFPGQRSGRHLRRLPRHGWRRDARRRLEPAAAPRGDLARVRDGTHDLDGSEIAGALVAQIQALVDDRCRQHRSLAAPAPEQRPAAASSRLTRPALVVEQPPTTAPAPAREGQATTTSVEPRPGQEVPSLAELLATVQQGQPLVAAGPPSNGTNP